MLTLACFRLGVIPVTELPAYGGHERSLPRDDTGKLREKVLGGTYAAHLGIMSR